jgi:hypothetical protein
MIIGSRQRAAGKTSKARIFGFALSATLFFALSASADALQSKKIPRIGYVFESVALAATDFLAWGFGFDIVTPGHLVVP